ncbi:MAG: response regulator [Eubacterium sp.]|nr:response regulator [Eubacterium sp.]
MGNYLVWEDRYNIGIDRIDNEHKKLFHIINKLFKFSGQEVKAPWVCQEGIKYFKDHAIKHFAEEEAYMESIAYKGLQTHKRLHDDFSNRTLPLLEKELEQSGYEKEAIEHFLGVCAGWLIGHTLTEDRAMTGGEASKWVNLMPEEEQFVVKQTIIRLLHDMFRLESQVVSECYGGEKFGKGVYYRLTYGSANGKQQEVILVFEENLLVETVGKMIGDTSGKLNVVIMDAARYTARQFVESIQKRFSSQEVYQLESEHLLTYEQFQKMFDRQLPQYSLLFDAGAGYFAYCAMTPHPVKRKKEGTVQEEHTMTDIEKYLQDHAKEKNARKKKLLVVDDSDTVQLAMKGLLQEDYQITVANSGTSAICCMTLERPDLVLLDYDMPVCDGAQVLKMIRSETELADIPVFFLTGKVDKESVSKVIPLKPEGYLLKSAKPAEIKKNIDRYFEKKAQGNGGHK